MIRHIWAVLGGRKPGSDQEVISSDNMIYLGILHNNGNSGATSPVLSNKLIEVWPKKPAYIWISAPEGGREGAPPQGWVKKSDSNDTSHSTAKIYMKYSEKTIKIFDSATPFNLFLFFLNYFFKANFFISYEVF